MLVQDLDVCLAADTFKEQVDFKVVQGYKASCLAHVDHKRLGLLLNDFWDPVPVFRFDLVEQECEQEVLHTIS